MKMTTRLMLAAMLCTAAVACSKKVKEEAPVDTGPSTGTVAPAPSTAGAYTPAQLSGLLPANIGCVKGYGVSENLLDCDFSTVGGTSSSAATA